MDPKCRINLPKKFNACYPLTWMLIFFLFSSNVRAGIGETDEKGWTVLTPSASTRICYVDATHGDDATAHYYDASSLSDIRAPGPVNAFKTITAAANAARDGHPDWILLRRGETWTDENLGRFKSGQSAENPIVLSHYGSSGNRPLIKNSDNFIDHNGRARSNFVLHGLHIYNYRHDPDSPEYTSAQTGTTLRFVGGGENILIEDCKLEFNEIVVQGYQGRYRNVQIRRSIIADNYYKNSANDNNTRPSGIFASEVHGLLIEQCVFDHNGWNEAIPGAAANMYNHNLYLTYNCSGKKVINNIITRGAAHGMQLRGCGIAEDNLFVQNAVALNLGYHGHESVYDTIAIAKNNVILEGRQMDPEGITGGLSTGAVWGIWTSRERFLVENNIVANKIASVNGSAFPNDHGAITDYVNNIVYQWDNQRDMTDPNWNNPGRSVGSYHESLGKAPTLEAFLEEVRNRPLAEWPEEYEAKSVNDYIREGFSYAGNHDPEVSFTSSGAETDYAPVTVQFTSESSDPDHDDLQYIWKFENRFFYTDGTSRKVDYEFSKEKNPAYTYNYPGTFKVTCTIYDGKGGSRTFTDSVTISGNYPPVATITSDVVSGDAPLIVHFDASGTYDENNDPLTFHYDFGDGTVVENSDNTVSHVYAPGTYTVTFYAEDGTNRSFEKNLTLEVSDPATEFNAYPVEADASLNADYPDTNFGSLYHSRIDANSLHGIFRMNYPAIEHEIVHAALHIASKYGTNRCELKYLEDDSWEESTVTWNSQPAGGPVIGSSDYQDGWAVFEITDAVKNEQDNALSVLLYETVAGWQEFRFRETSYALPFLQVETKISTDNHSPEVNLSADVTQGETPLTVNFDGSASSDPDGDDLSFTWDFGDGSGTSQGEKIRHVFPDRGSYVVTLIADDGKPAEHGSRSFATMLINAGETVNSVNETAAGVIKIFPNPVHAGRLNYILQGENTGIQITDVAGNVVIEKPCVNKSGTLDVSSLRSGVYLFVVKNSRSLITERFVMP